MTLSLKELKAKMVPASSKEGKGIDNQYLYPSSYDKNARKEFKLSLDDAETVADHDEMNRNSENFTVQDKIKKNTRAPLREYSEESASPVPVVDSSDNSVRVNIAYEDESLELLEQITGLVERLEFDHGYFWKDVACHLKEARNCLLRQPIGESVVTELDEEMLEEAFKRGNFKLRDGSKVKLTKEDVEALNAAIAGTKNATHLVNEITENEKEFNQFLSFAKKLDESFDDIIENFLMEATTEELTSLSEDGDVDIHEVFRHAKAGAELGATIGKNVGSVAGTVYGGVVGAGIGAGIGAAKSAPKLKDLVKKWNEKKSIKEDPGGDDDDNEDEPLGYDEKESVLGTAAPAMDSHIRKDKQDLREIYQRAFTRITGIKPVGRTSEPHRFADSIGGHSSNYKDPVKVSYDRSRIKDMSNDGFKYDTEYYKSASKEERINLEKKWGARASYFKEEELQEISKDKTEKYLDKAITDHGHSNFAKNSTEKNTKEHQFWSKRTDKRKKGISKAIDSLDKKNKKEDLQEVSAKTLNSYIDGAMQDQMAASITKSSNQIKNNKKFGSTKEIRDFINKRQKGIDKAEDSLERKEATNNLYKKLGLNKLVKD